MAKSTYDPSYDAVAYELYSKGKVDRDVAEAVGCSLKTVRNWRKQFPSFLQAFKEGKAEADKKVERALFERAVGYSHADEKIFCQDGRIHRAPTVKHYPPCMNAIQFWLTNRQPDVWKHRQHQEITGKDGGPIQTESGVRIYLPDNRRDDPWSDLL